MGGRRITRPETRGSPAHPEWQQRYETDEIRRAADDVTGMRPEGILETVLYADDLDAAEAFYGGVIGLERIARQTGRHVFYRCGSGVLLIFDPERTEVEATLADAPGVPPHGARGPGHMAFSAPSSELDRWKRHLTAAGVEIEAEVDWPRGGRSLYFRDPAGNSIEIASPQIWDL